MQIAAGKWRSRVRAYCTTDAEPNSRHVFVLNPPNNARTAREAALTSSSMFLYLSDGNYKLKELDVLDPLQDGSWREYSATARIKAFKKEILDYNDEQNVFLLKCDFRERLKLAIEYTGVLKRRVHFTNYQYPDPAHFETISCSQFIDFVKNTDQSAFLSGAAGTGKTWFVNKVLVPALHGVYKGNRNRVWLTATTGQAGELIDGFTIHSKAGLQRGKGSAEMLIQKMNSIIKKRYKQVRCVVIEEFP